MRYFKIIIFTIVAFLCCDLVYANDEETIDGLRYKWVSWNASQSMGRAKLLKYSTIKESYTIPYSVKWPKAPNKGRNAIVASIENRAFANHPSLRSITILGTPSIGSGAFTGCTILSAVHIEAKGGGTLENGAFDEVTYKNATLYVPKGEVEKYKNSASWGKFENITDGIDGTIKNQHTITVISSYGSVNYNGTTVENESKKFYEFEGSSITLTFTPREGRELANLIIDGEDVTSKVVNNQYTIDNVSKSMEIQASFFSITITAKGNGHILCEKVDQTIPSLFSSAIEYGDTRNGTDCYIVPTGGYYLRFNIYPDEGYQLAAALKDGTNITLNSTIPNGFIDSYNISYSANLEFTFDEISPVTHTLSIKAIGNGAVSYNGTDIRGEEMAFSVEEGYSAILSFTPDPGYRIKSVKLNNTNITSNLTNNQYTISNINSDNNLEVEFEPIIHSLTIKASGYGSATYNNTEIRDNSISIDINEGTSAIVAFTPDAGYRIKSVKLNNTNVTSSITNGQYTISNISSDNTLEVEFEKAIYTLSIKSIGNGTTTYNSTTIREQGSSFTVNEGSSAVITFSPDAGHRIKNVVINGVDVTAIITNFQYTISNIVTNTTVEVEYEAIPITTYSFTIQSIGNGSAIYNGTTIRGNVSSFTVNEGTSATVTFTPDAGYRIASVKLNGTDVTSGVVSNKYTISNIIVNTTVAVIFEAITHTLSITATGNGSATYNSTSIRGKTTSFTVNEGTSATITFTPDAGYRIASVKLNGTDVTSSVVNNKYTISNITADMTLAVIFEAITHMLSITASGNGTATYNRMAVREKTQSFTVNEGSSATISFAPDAGYQIASVKVNGADVTSCVVSNKYTISNITANSTLAVTFEAIPPTTYTLSITASGNGYVAYDGNTVRGKTSSFSVEEGINAILKFSADEGNRLKSVKVNGQDVTSTIVNNQYTISIISANTTVEVAFEVIPSYSLNIVALGNGNVVYNGTTIRNQSQSFTLQEGYSAVITITSDAGYRIKSVKLNSADVTSQVTNGQITISNIKQDTNVEVSFEAIPPTTYSLTITATGEGSVTYDGINVRGGSSTFTIVEGSYVTIQIAADDGYRLKQVTQDGKDVTADIANGLYTTTKLMANTTLTVEFEAIPTFSLTIKSTAFGSVKFGDAVITNRIDTFSVREGVSAVLAFMADGNGRLIRITLNGTDITNLLENEQYTISDIRADQSVEAEYAEDITKLTFAGVAYSVMSYDEETVIVAAGNYGLVLTVPATFEAKGKTWTVVGIDNDALSNATELAAVIWQPEAAFTAKVNNPNLLLYVKKDEYAPTAIQNVVVDDVAENIVLVEAENGNNFYCPKAFTAKRISYEHNYSMISGYKTCQGWETLVLPFDVSTMVSTKGTELVPYSTWTYGSSLRPFWLYQLTGQGWKAADGIKANVPYIVCMPNNEMYDSSYNLTGNIQFVGNNVLVKPSDNLTAEQYGNKRLVANYQNQPVSAGIYALNVSNDWYQNTAAEKEGSVFIRSLRDVHPFEAYLTVEGNAASQRVISIFDNDVPTSIFDIETMKCSGNEEWYTIDGRQLQSEPKQKGIYIYRGKKVRK